MFFQIHWNDIKSFVFFIVRLKKNDYFFISLNDPFRSSIVCLFSERHHFNEKFYLFKKRCPTLTPGFLFLDRLFNETRTESDLTPDTGKLHLYVKEDDSKGAGEAVTDFFKQFSESSKQEEKRRSNDDLADKIKNEAFDDKSESKHTDEDTAQDISQSDFNEALDDKSESKHTDEDTAQESSQSDSNEALDDKSESKQIDVDTAHERSLKDFNEALDDKSKSKDTDEEDSQERSLNGENFDFEIVKTEEKGKNLEI